MVPDGRPELILNQGQPAESWSGGEWRTQPQCFLAGQLTGPLLLRSAGAARILGVRFRPGGAAQLLGMPVEELTDHVVAAGDLGLQNLAGSSTLSEIERTLLDLERGTEDALVDEAARMLGHAADVGATAAAPRRQSAPARAALQSASRNVAQTLRAHPPLSACLPCDRGGRRLGGRRCRLRILRSGPPDSRLSRLCRRTAFPAAGRR